MGCKWPKFGVVTKVFPHNTSTKHFVPAMNNAAVKQQNIGSVNITLQPLVWDGVDHSKQNNKRIVTDDSIKQPISIPVKNIKPVLPDQYTKDKNIKPVLPVQSTKDKNIKPVLPVQPIKDKNIKPLVPVQSTKDKNIKPVLPVQPIKDKNIKPLVPVQSTKNKNIKLLLPDQSIKDKAIAIVHDTTDYPTSPPVNQAVQTFEQVPTHETPNQHPPERINSGTSIKRPVSAKSEQQEEDHHDEKINDETFSIHEKSVVEENTVIIPDTIDDQVEEKINDSTEDSTIAENLLSERIDSGTSSKHSLSSHNNDDQSHIVEDDMASISDASVVDEMIDALPASINDYVEILDADPRAFNILFVKQRQYAVENSFYRSTIESWKPNSLQQLNGNLETLAKGKSLIDCHWIIFYWIACNIEYDAISYSNDNIPGQSVEEAFRTKKCIYAGYSRLYKYFCDRLRLRCEEISGYAKGYGFDNREEDALLKKDHAWNAVEINRHWYLVDSTWGTGHLNEQKTFTRQLDCFYFLARPQQMIYHHLPKDNKWQLLQTPIKMTQYSQMPRLRPAYFDLNLRLISPLHQAHVSLVRDKSYALVLIRTPIDVELSANLKLHKNKVEGGHRIVFDADKQLYRCYFAPASAGKHKIELFAKNINSNSTSYEYVVDFALNIDELPQNPVSYPATWEKFYDLGMKVLSPVNTHLIKVCDGVTDACIIIRAPNDVELTGHLMDNEGNKIAGGHQVYYDKQKSLWKCKFIPDQDGLFEANIFGKKKSDTGSYSAVISFKIEATDIPSPPLSYPKTWQIFHDLNLKVISPPNCSTIFWPENASVVEILIEAPDDVQLSCSIKYNNVDVKNGSLVQFDNEKMLWQLLFAPERIGQHELIVFAKRTNEEISGCAVKFQLNVTQLHHIMKFPMVYSKFHTTKCRIYEPLNGVLKKGTTVPIHCMIPGAIDVNLQADSNWLKTEGYQDLILNQQVTVGSKDVTIYAKYEEESSYDALVKYSVQ